MNYYTWLEIISLNEVKIYNHKGSFINIFKINKSNGIFHKFDINNNTNE